MIITNIIFCISNTSCIPLRSRTSLLVLRIRKTFRRSLFSCDTSRLIVFSPRVLQLSTTSAPRPFFVPSNTVLGLLISLLLASFLTFLIIDSLLSVLLQFWSAVSLRHLCSRLPGESCSCFLKDEKKIEVGCWKRVNDDTVYNNCEE